jgi:hypothetical protein
MAITKALALLSIDDITAYSEARRLVKHGRAIGDVALHAAAVGVAACVAEALRAADARGEVRRLREAELALAQLRDRAWTLRVVRAISDEIFDELMASSARCRRDAARLEASARRRARQILDGA